MSEIEEFIKSVGCSNAQCYQGMIMTYDTDGVPSPSHECKHCNTKQYILEKVQSLQAEVDEFKGMYEIARDERSELQKKLKEFLEDVGGFCNGSNMLSVDDLKYKIAQLLNQSK